MTKSFKAFRRKKRFKVAVSIVLIFILFQFTSGCFSFRMSPKEVNKYFKEKAIAPDIQNYKVDGRNINYAQIGDTNLPTVFFFHGAPGSWSAFIDFMADTSITNHFRIISVDRPGYGYSDFGNSVTSLETESKLMEPLLDLRNKNQPTILIGHSLGGPVVARLAMDYPQIVDHIVMVAPSIDPTLEPDEDWFRYPLKTPFLRWVLPISFRVTNDEIYHLEDELNDMLPLWKNITIPVTVIQGGKDSLVPAGNADFAKKMLTNSQKVDIVLIEDMNHFVPWSHPHLIKEAIFKHADLR